MVFQPLTYAGQYPPLEPRSASDVSSFEMLHSSLRSQLPEMAREGDKILNEEMLARLVDGVMRFQRDHLGRKAKSKYWPTVRLPSPLLADRSSYPGPLGTAILSAFRIKQISPWRNFNFDNPKLFDDNISIIKKMEGDLIDRGYLKRPVIYFDTTVEEKRGKAEVARLSKIAARFGAKVSDDPRDVRSGRVTHIVAFDPEEHDSKEVIEEEERRDQAGEEMDKTYLKTLAVVDADIDGEKKKMALVHWWYHPSSYDEWMNADDVSGDVETDEHPGIPGGPAVVGCKFIRDVERFNEWGLEADYAVMEYERKIAYLRKETKSSKKSSKKSKRSSSSSAKSEQPVVESVEQAEPAAKKKRIQEDEIESKSLLMEAPPSPVAQPKKSKSKSSPPKNAAAIHNPSLRHVSERRAISGGTGGMTPRRILTGMRGQRNEVLRRIVHDGALRVENEPYTVVREALADYLMGSGKGGGKSDVKEPILNARPEWRKHLPPTGFVRPSVDSSMKCMTVTELTLSNKPPPAVDEGDMSQANAVATLAVHRSVPILVSPEEETPGDGAGDEAPASIRGGGLEGDDPVAEQPEAAGGQEEPALGTVVPANPESVQPAEDAQPPPGTSDAAAGNPDMELGQEAAAADVAAGQEAVATHEVGKDDAMDVDEVSPPAEESQTEPVESLDKPPEADTAIAHPEAPKEDGAVAPGDAAAPPATPPMEGQPEAPQQDTTPMVMDTPAAEEDFKDASDKNVPEVAAAEIPGKASDETPPEAATTENVEKGSEAASLQAPPADDSAALAEVTSEPASEAAPALEAAPASEAASTDQQQTADATPAAAPVEASPAQTAEAPTVAPAERQAPAMTAAAAAVGAPPAPSEAPVAAPPAPAAAAPVATPTGPAVAPVAAPPALVAVAPVAAPPAPTAAVAAVASSAAPTPVAPVAAPPPPVAAAPVANPVAVLPAPTAAPTAALTAVASPAAPVAPAAVAPVSAPQAPAASTPALASTAPAAVAPATATAPTATTAAAPVITAPSTATTQVTSGANPTTAVAGGLTGSTAKTTSAAETSGQQQPAKVCQVVPLPSGTQLSTSLHRSSAAAASEEDARNTAAKPSWYNHTQPSEFEKRSLPEWFNSSAAHRTESTYISTREKILDLALRNGQQYITSTAIRRSVAGDAGSLLRMHKFLMDCGLLNGGQIGETAPSDAVLRGLHSEGGPLATARQQAKRKYAQVETSCTWTATRMLSLETAVVKNVSKGESDPSDASQIQISVDWDAVAADLGGGLTAEDCQRAFLEPPSEDAKMVADAAAGGGKNTFSQLLDGVRPEVLKAAIDASLRCTDDISEARRASFVAAVASAAAEKGAQAEAEVESTLMDIVDQRLQRLENRVALLDDVEALLEAERVSLELERRDMYTARCRHWFGDGSS